MMNSLSLQFLVILIGLTFTVLIFGFLFSNGTNVKQSYIAIDGTKFSSEKDCDEYNLLFKRLGSIFDKDDRSSQSSKNRNLGINPLFFVKLTEEGFSEFNILIKYKNDFIKFAELLNIEDNDAEA